MKIKSIIALASVLALQAAPVRAIGEPAKVAIAVGSGVTVGVGASATVGSIGVAVGGTAFAIGMAPVAVVGGIVGLAGYGIYRLFH